MVGIDRHFRLDSNLTLAPDFTTISAVFKNAGLLVSMVDLKNIFLTLKVICIHLFFPVADLITSSFLTVYSGSCHWMVFTTEGEMFRTQYSGSLSEVMKSQSSSAVISEIASTIPTLFLELQPLAKWPFLLQFLYVTFFAGHESFLFGENSFPQK